MLFKLELPPGLASSNTEYSNAGRWNAASLIRFVEGMIKPMKGWVVGFSGKLSGNPRAAHAWYDNEGDAFAAFATHSKIYAHDGTTIDDITPSVAAGWLLENGTAWLMEDGTEWLLEGGIAVGDADTSTVTLDNFGEVLIACFDHEQDIYEWQPHGGSDVTVVTNSPQARAIFVTDERILVGLGTDGDPRRLTWCDQENRTIWTPTAVNQAGDYTLQTTGVLMCGTKIRGGNLLWTSVDLHYMRYIGLPDVYGFERVASNCGIVGRHAFEVVDTAAYWMGVNGFWKFAGYVEPIPCSISDDVFSNMNTTYRSKCWCEHRPEDGEIWFYYPREAETECSHAAIFNYREGTWYHTEMPRLCGFNANVFGFPVRVDSGGTIYKHETGWNYNDDMLLLESGDGWLLEDGTPWLLEQAGASADRYLISGPVEIGSGETRMQIDEFIPDEKTQGDCEVYFYTRDTPNAAETTMGPYNSSDRVGVITTARQARIEIRAEEDAEDFRVGMYRVSARPRGRY